MAWRDKLHIFRFWSQKVLPQVYDDALSYYEVLNKVAAFLNECIEKVNELIDEQEAYEDAMNQAWESFKDEMKDEWKAYKVLMEETWNEFKQYILDNLDTWEEETRQQVIANINHELELIIANLKHELEVYIDGKMTYVVKVEYNLTTQEYDIIEGDINDALSAYSSGGLVYLVINNMIPAFPVDISTVYNYIKFAYIMPWNNGTDYIKKLDYNFLIFDTTASTSRTMQMETYEKQMPFEFPFINNGDSGKVLKVKSDETGVEWGVDGTGDTLPSYGPSEANKVLKVNGTGDDIEWATDGTGDTLPSYGPSEANKVLKVNSSGSDIGWENDDDTKELPNIVSGDARKILRVKNDLSGVEWSAESNELPSYSASDANKVLRLNGSGSTPEWTKGTEEISIGTYNSPTLPQGYDYTTIRNLLSVDKNSVVLVGSIPGGTSYIIRCIAVMSSYIRFAFDEIVQSVGSFKFLKHVYDIDASSVTYNAGEFTGTPI